MTKLLASALFAATLVAAPAVYAIDIENQDGVDHNVTILLNSTISGATAPYPFTLKAGEVHKDLCMGEGCTVELNGAEWAGGGDTALVIKDGKLSVKPKAPRS